MNRYNLATFAALFVVVLVFPAYMMLEPVRMEHAQQELRQEMVSDAAVLYVESCALCHGAAGEGIGAMPALDTAALRESDYDFLYKTMARGRYGTTMVAWLDEEGGIYSSYQIEELVALIRFGDWTQLRELAAQRGLIPPTMPVPEVGEALLTELMAMEPADSQWSVGLQLYALNCTVCHGLDGHGTNLGVALRTDEIAAADPLIIANLISSGVAGTAMPAWAGTLSPDDISALVAFIQNWEAIEAQGIVLTPPEPIHIDIDNPQDMLSLGEQLFATTCSVCHGENGSGGSGPALNSQQILTNRTDSDIQNTIVSGGRRPNSSMPAFGDRFTAVEIEALLDYIRAWEPTAPFVANPRGTASGGGPPWLRTPPDAATPDATPYQGGQGGGGKGGGPPWRQQ